MHDGVRDERSECGDSAGDYGAAGECERDVRRDGVVQCDGVGSEFDVSMEFERGAD